MVDRFIASSKAGKTVKQGYKKSIQQYKAYTGLDYVDFDGLVKFRDAMLKMEEEGKQARKTTRDKLQHLRQYAKFYDAGSWVNKVDMPQKEAVKGIIVHQYQLLGLLWGAQHLLKDRLKVKPIEGVPLDWLKGWRVKRVMAVALLGATTGMRAEEIYRMKPSDINWSMGRVKVRSEKGGTTHTRTTFLNKETAKLLKEVIAGWDEHPEVGVLFGKQTLNRDFKLLEDVSEGWLVKYGRKYFARKSKSQPTAGIEGFGYDEAWVRRVGGWTLTGDVLNSHYATASVDELQRAYNDHWLNFSLLKLANSRIKKAEDIAREKNRELDVGLSEEDRAFYESLED